MTDSFDEWENWQPDWSFKSKKKKTKKTANNTQNPHALQEQHSPTTAILVKTSNKRKSKKYQQRILDARLWNKMTNAQQDAALAIDRAFQLMSKGLGYRISAPHLAKISTSRVNHSDYEGELINIYFKWAKSCKEKELHHSAAIDILIYGKSCIEVDRNRRVRNGWAKNNLLESLNIYCKIRGWL